MLRHAFFYGKILLELTLRVYLTLFILILLLVVAFIFGSQNHQLLTLNYLIARAEISVATAVSLFTFIGFLLGLFTAILWKLVRAVRPKQNIKANKGAN